MTNKICQNSQAKAATQVFIKMKKESTNQCALVRSALGFALISFSLFLFLFFVSVGAISLFFSTKKEKKKLLHETISFRWLKTIDELIEFMPSAVRRARASGHIKRLAEIFDRHCLWPIERISLHIEIECCGVRWPEKIGLIQRQKHWQKSCVVARKERKSALDSSTLQHFVSNVGKKGANRSSHSCSMILWVFKERELERKQEKK